MRTYKGHVKSFFKESTSLEYFLKKLTPLSTEQIYDVTTKGGVWIQRSGRGKILRLRELREKVFPDDLITLNFDHKVLSLPELTHLELIFNGQNYSVWFKPAGIVSQGSQSSDHASVLRYVEKHRGQEVYLVHRLDRETEGPMIVAHNSKAASYLSDLFQKNKIKKIYQAVVIGNFKIGHKETINSSLDDKEAITHFEVVDSKGDLSLVRIDLETGRFHQIRRHFDFIGHPVLGDPKYGKGNKNKEGLKLLAFEIRFLDPWLKSDVVYRSNKSLSI